MIKSQEKIIFAMEAAIKEYRYRREAIQRAVEEIAAITGKKETKKRKPRNVGFQDGLQAAYDIMIGRDVDIQIRAGFRGRSYRVKYK